MTCFGVLLPRMPARIPADVVVVELGALVDVPVEIDILVGAAVEVELVDEVEAEVVEELTPLLVAFDPGGHPGGLIITFSGSHPGLNPFPA